MWGEWRRRCQWIAAEAVWVAHLLVDGPAKVDAMDCLVVDGERERRRKIDDIHVPRISGVNLARL